MLISVTASSKGLGQSVTAINLAVMISRLIDERTLIIDINKYCKDIVYYLSNSICTKGLDDFKSLLEAKILNNKTVFNSCVKNVHKNLDIMDSNENCDFTDIELGNLVSYTDEYYPVTVVDTISGRNSFSQSFLDKSDVIIIIVNQTKNSISKIFEDVFYVKNKHKVIFIVNQYMSSYENKKVRYTMKEITRDLSKLQIGKERIFKLSFDIDLKNDCNENAILNYVFNSSKNNSKYLKQLETISKHVIESYGNIHVDNLRNLATQNKSPIFGSIFNLKQRSSLDAKYD